MLTKQRGRQSVVLDETIKWILNAGNPNYVKVYALLLHLQIHGINTPISVADIGRVTNIGDYNHAFHIVRTLKEAGFISQGDTGVYSVSPIVKLLNEPQSIASSPFESLQVSSVLDYIDSQVESHTECQVETQHESQGKNQDDKLSCSNELIIEKDIETQDESQVKGQDECQRETQEISQDMPMGLGETMANEQLMAVNGSFACSRAGVTEGNQINSQDTEITYCESSKVSKDKEEDNPEYNNNLKDKRVVGGKGNSATEECFTIDANEIYEYGAIKIARSKSKQSTIKSIVRLLSGTHRTIKNTVFTSQQLKDAIDSHAEEAKGKGNGRYYDMKHFFGSSAYFAKYVPGYEHLSPYYADGTTEDVRDSAYEIYEYYVSKTGKNENKVQAIQNIESILLGKVTSLGVIIHPTKDQMLGSIDAYMKSRGSNADPKYYKMPANFFSVKNTYFLGFIRTDIRRNAENVNEPSQHGHSILDFIDANDDGDKGGD